VTFHSVFPGNKIQCTLNVNIYFCIQRKYFNTLLLFELITNSHPSVN
jgi:hypothetical protein